MIKFLKKVARKIKEFFSIEKSPVKDDKKNVVNPSFVPPASTKCNCKSNDEIEGKQLSIFDIEEIEVEEIVEEKKENDIKIERHTAETITRSILIDFLKTHGVKGSLSRLKKAELLEKFYELDVEFPEKK